MTTAAFQFLFRQNRVAGVTNNLDEFVMNGVEISNTTRDGADWSALLTACAGILTTQGRGATVAGGSFVPGFKYEIVTAGTTNYTLIGAADSVAGTVFYATGVGSGNGTARLAEEEDAIIGIGRIVSNAVVLDEVYRDGTKVVTSIAATESALTAPLTTLGMIV